jgi:hypothetical protein
MGAEEFGGKKEGSENKEISGKQPEAQGFSLENLVTKFRKSIQLKVGGFF